MIPTREIMYKCPADGCGHAGEFITLHHIRSAHGINTLAEFESTYGKPAEMNTALTTEVKRWARTSRNLQPLKMSREF